APHLEDADLSFLLGELAHRGDQLRLGWQPGLVILGCLDHCHETHDVPRAACGMKVPLQHHDERSLVGSTMRREIFKSLFPAGANSPHLDRGEFGGRAFTRITDGVLTREIEQEEAPDDLLRLSEGAVNEAALAVARRDTDTFGCRAERVVSFQNAAC